MLAALRKGAPNAVFFVNDSSVGTPHSPWKAEKGLDFETFRKLPELGYQEGQIHLNGPGCEFNNLDGFCFANFNIRPAPYQNRDHGTNHWRTGSYPDGLCCNSSYRSHPYQLEQPAKALAENAEHAAFYRSLRKAGKTLFVYSCDGPSRTLDPLGYYRFISYVAFRNGAKGVGFWAFGHAPGTDCDSWHAYSQTGLEFSPYFVSSDGAAATKQGEGIREGVEDYEYLSMLADRIRADAAAGRDVSSARKLVRDGVERVLAVCREKVWSAANDRTAMDALRLQVLRELEK